MQQPLADLQACVCVLCSCVLILWRAGTQKVAESAKEVTFYVLGTNDDGAAGNYWTSLDDWPTYTSEKWYLHSDGSLSTKMPTMAANHSYLYDPRNPVPTLGGNNLFGSCGPKDQTPHLSRHDVLVYASEPMAEPYAITGPLFADLFVSSANVNDTDFTVKLMVNEEEQVTCA